MSIRQKNWLSVAALSFVVISSSVIAYNLRNGAYVDNSTTESNQLNTSTQSSAPDSKNTLLASPTTEVADKNQRFLSGLESSVSIKTKALVKDISCYAFKMGISSDQDGRATRIRQFLVIRFK